MNIARTIVTSMVTLSSVFALVASIDMGLRYYQAESQFRFDATRIPTSPSRTSVAYLTVISIEPATRTLLARVRSQTTISDLDTRLYLPEVLKIERQDPILQDGVMIGVQPIAPADMSEVQPGARGVGVISMDDNGRAQLSYLLIGTPFPRP
jgi:hypothetical protein